MGAGRFDEEGYRGYGGLLNLFAFLFILLLLLLLLLFNALCWRSSLSKSCDIDGQIPLSPLVQIPKALQNYLILIQ